VDDPSDDADDIPVRNQYLLVVYLVLVEPDDDAIILNAEQEGLVELLVLRRALLDAREAYDEMETEPEPEDAFSRSTRLYNTRHLSDEEAKEAIDLLDRERSHRPLFWYVEFEGLLVHLGFDMVA